MVVYKVHEDECGRCFVWCLAVLAWPGHKIYTCHRCFQADGYEPCAYKLHRVPDSASEITAQPLLSSHEASGNGLSAVLADAGGEKKPLRRLTVPVMFDAARPSRHCML